MRWMMMAGAASMLGGGAYLGGAFDGGEYYAIPHRTVETRLAMLQFGEELSPAERKRISLVLRSRSADMLRWDLMSEGRRMGDVRAYLAADGAGTRVRVEFQFADGQTKLLGLEDESFVNEFAEILMDEKVDSALDGRTFDESVVEARMAAAVAANPQAFARLEDKIEKREERARERLQPDPSDMAYDAPPSSLPIQAEELDYSETHADGGWGNK